MKNLLNFLIESGKLKSKQRRRWLINQIKNPETTAEHIFHLTLLVWVLGKNKNINLERAIKMALVHDLCKVYSFDFTPYDPLLPEDKKEIMKVLKKWPNFTPILKIKREKNKYKTEFRALNKLIANLPADLKSEIKGLWIDYKKVFTKEARFVKQADKIVNLLQGMEYWKKYGKIQHKIWIRWIKEIVDDPDLIEFENVLENKFCKNCKKEKNKTIKKQKK